MAKKTRRWNKRLPPEDTLVEAKSSTGDILRVKLVYSTNPRGIIPHWKDLSGKTYPVTTFNIWREILDND